VARGLDPEVGGELLVAVLATGTQAAHAAVASRTFEEPLRRGVWQGFKRTWKLLEARLLGDDAPGRAGAPRTTLAAWAPKRRRRAALARRRSATWRSSPTSST
jgi:hypothetical protein